jgi:hypothetical protein
VFQYKNEFYILYKWFIYLTISFTYYRYLPFVEKWGFKEWMLVDVMGFEE